MAALIARGSSFSILEARHTFEVIDDNSTTFRSWHIYVLRAEMPSRFFERRYFWSGTDHTDSPEITCNHDIWGHPIHRIHGPVIREGTARIVVVDLGRTIEAGALETVNIEHQMRDFGGSFQPRLGQRAWPGLERVSLTVILPPSLADKVTFREVMQDTEFDTHVERIEGTASGTGRKSFSKEIASNFIQQNRAYRLCWAKLA